MTTGALSRKRPIHDDAPPIAIGRGNVAPLARNSGVHAIQRKACLAVVEVRGWPEGFRPMASSAIIALCKLLSMRASVAVSTASTSVIEGE